MDYRHDFVERNTEIKLICKRCLFECDMGKMCCIYGLIWADTDIRIIAKITAQSVRRIFIVLSLKYSLFY